MRFLAPEVRALLTAGMCWFALLLFARALTHHDVRFMVLMGVCAVVWGFFAGWDIRELWRTRRRRK